MVAHDAWFYGMHRLFHQARHLFPAPFTYAVRLSSLLQQNALHFNLNEARPLAQVKPLFRLVHQRHHQNGSNVTALGTAFGDAADIGLCFVAFHFVLGVALFLLPRWNLVGVVTLIAFEVRALRASMSPKNHVD